MPDRKIYIGYGDYHYEPSIFEQPSIGFRTPEEALASAEHHGRYAAVLTVVVPTALLKIEKVGYWYCSHCDTGNWDETCDACGNPRP